MWYATILAAMCAQTPTAADSPDEEWGDCQQTQSIEWFRPGSLSAALDRCRETGRILMIKGVSFGIDEVGLEHPTKGTW